MLMAWRFLAYPEGVEFTLTLRLHPATEEWYAHPWDLPHRRSRGGQRPPPDDLLRFGLLYPDGSKWTNMSGFFPQLDQEPATPVVIGRGGGGGGSSWDMAYWLWPLPPDGPLTFFAEWPALKVKESSASVDGRALRQAAAEAEVVWPT